MSADRAAVGSKSPQRFPPPPPRRHTVASQGATGASSVTPVIVLTLAAGAMGAVNFAFGLIVAKLAGESTWSAVSPMLAAGTAGSFVGLGFEYAVSRVVVRRQPLRVVGWWATAIGIAGLLLTGLAGVLSGPIASFLHLGSSMPVELSTGLFCVTVLAAIPSGLLVGHRRFAMLAALGVLGALTRVVMLWAVGGTWVNRALVASIVGTLIGAVMMTLGGCRRSIGTTVEGGQEVARLGRYAFGGSAAQLALWVTMVAPVVAARHFLPLRTAGELATVTFVSSGLAYLAAPVATVFFPAMVADRSRALVRRGLALSAAVVVGGGALMVAIGPPLLVVLYGSRQSHLTLLLALGATAVLTQSTSGFLAWAALARCQRIRGVLAGCAASLPLVGLLALWHSSAGALLVAVLPSAAAVGVVSSFVRGLTPSPLASSPRALPVSGCSPPVEPVAVSVGIMAYNEQGSVGDVVRRFLEEPAGIVRVAEVVVVASGCTDATAAAARRAGVDDDRLVVVEEPQRNGKLAAVSLFFQRATSEIAVVSGADTLPERGALQELCRPLVEDAEVGMTGPRVMPLPGSNCAQRLHQVLWELHHRVALEAPKLGEIVAIRHRGLALRSVSGCDEVVMEHAVSSCGRRLTYAPGAVVHNRGPVSVGDYFRWRKRLAAQHCRAARHGMRPSTMSLSLCVGAAISLFVDEPGSLLALVACAAIEVIARAGGRRAARRGQDFLTWAPSLSSRVQALSGP